MIILYMNNSVKNPTITMNKTIKKYIIILKKIF